MKGYPNEHRMSWPNDQQTRLVSIYPVKVRGYPPGEPHLVMLDFVGNEVTRDELLIVSNILREYAETMPK
jgi:hypothetical protein